MRPQATSTRPLYWSVRRELWENRSIWIAPIMVPAVALVAFVATLPGLPRHVGALSGPDAEMAHLHVHGPYGIAALAGFAIAFIVSVLFCMDALQSERRDRSILFWKSMPVSDRTTVLSKAMIPLAVLPLIVFVVTVAVHAGMMVLSSIVLLVGGASVAALMSHLQPVQGVLTMLYAVIVLALWHAPIYALVLLISGAVRQATLLWVAVPLLAIFAIEHFIFGAIDYDWIEYVLLGWVKRGFAFTNDASTTLLQELTPLRLLSTPSLWGGLAFTAVCLTAAVHLRRHRGPT